MAINGYYDLKKGATGKYSFNLVAGNHQVILVSESYAQKSGAEGGIASVQKNGAEEAHFDRRTSSNQKPYFVLKSGNGQIIGTSEMYESTAARDNGIESVKTNSPSVKVNDHTGE
jgi:uncharacterized protein YegP (UPF0339 family)